MSHHKIETSTKNKLLIENYIQVYLKKIEKQSYQ